MHQQSLFHRQTLTTYWGRRNKIYALPTKQLSYWGGEAYKTPSFLLDVLPHNFGHFQCLFF